MAWCPVSALTTRRPIRLAGGRNSAMRTEPPGRSTPEHLADCSGAHRFGQVMDHQAAHHDVVRAVQRVERFSDPLVERAVGEVR
jgi:hypothetical protein